MTFRGTSFGLHPCVSSVLTAAVFALAAPSASAQTTTGVGAISGVVVNAAGQPAEGVRVCALDTASCATSDAQGVFRIGDLRAGAYRLEILPLDGSRSPAILSTCVPGWTAPWRSRCPKRRTCSKPSP